MSYQNPSVCKHGRQFCLKCHNTVTKSQALDALESLDDYARMGESIEPIGPYTILKRYIEEGASV